MKRTAIALLLLLAASAARAQRPTFVVQPNGVVAAVLPLSVLSHAAVKKQLGTGLTTTFLLVARQRTTNVRSGARLEIRYDLWDDVWLVRRIEFDGRSERARITSLEALEKWWRTPVRVLASSANRVSLQLDLSVLPFSAAEKEDARQWISKSGGVANSGGGAGGIVDALIGTTIGAEPITSFKWNLELSLK
ncbi:MAG TPA: hypothetical protein VEK11_17200 [Thermoanaerobaculia bacterium]|nr:hypothetical protein [Thermoanaerobaculia bacterium]